MDEIEIKDVNFEAFASFLSLVLKDPIMPTVNNAVKLLELADRFLLPAARRPVEFFLLSASIGTLNKIRVAEMFQLEDLLEQAINNCREIVEKENFLADPTFQLISTATKARMFYKCMH
uniref:BTB domain-containing protein n=1 Tax=Caenorhabditis tropicalis TaxID=1561998 RepID=A0A1I7UI41_9PELO